MGDIMHAIEDAEVLLCKGIKEISGKEELDANTLGLLGEAIDAVEDIYKIRMYQDIDEGRYDDYGHSYGRNGATKRAMEYPDYLVRDTYMPIKRGYVNDGGYSRYTNGGSSDNGPWTDSGSRGEYGYSRGSVIEHLEHAIKDANNEMDRENIRRILEDMKRR